MRQGIQRRKEKTNGYRKITKREYTKVVDKYLELGLDGYVQDRESAKTLYIPSWDYQSVFDRLKYSSNI